MSSDTKKRNSHLLAGTLLILSGLHFWNSARPFAIILISWSILTISFVQRYGIIALRFHHIDKLFYGFHAALLMITAALMYMPEQRMLPLGYFLIAFAYMSHMTKPLQPH